MSQRKWIAGTLRLPECRWMRIGLVSIMVGAQCSSLPLSAASYRDSDAKGEGSGYSLSQIQKAEEAARASVTKSNAVQATLGAQPPLSGAVSPGEQAGRELQAQIKAAQLRVGKTGLESQAAFVTKAKSVQRVAQGNKTTTVTVYPGGQRLTTVATHTTTGDILSRTTHLADSKGQTLVTGTSHYIYRKNGDVEVRTVLVEGNKTVNSVAVHKADGTTRITGTEVNGAVGTGRATTAFVTNISASGYVEGTFTTTIDGSSTKSTGTQVNDVTHIRTTYGSGASSDEVITRLADGTIRTETTSRTPTNAFVYLETREIKTEKQSGIVVAVAPYEPARFYGTTATVIKITKRLIPAQWVNSHIQNIAEVVGGGTANPGNPFTITPMVGSNGGFKGSIRMSDGKILTFTGTFNPGSVGLNQLNFTLTFSDGRKVTSVHRQDTTTSITTYPGGQKQTTVTTHDPQSRKVVKSTTHLKDALGRTLANGTSYYSYRKDGSVQVKTVLTQGTSTINTVVVRKADGSVTITGTEVKGPVGTGRTTTNFVTKIDAKGGLSREFITTRDGSLTRTTGIQLNNVTRSVSTYSNGSRTEEVAVRSPDGTVRTQLTHYLYGGLIIRSTMVQKVNGFNAELSPFEPARFIATV